MRRITEFPKRGQALVEFALVLPLMVIFILGGLDLLSLAAAGATVAQAAQDGGMAIVDDAVHGVSLHAGGNSCFDVNRVVIANLGNAPGLDPSAAVIGVQSAVAAPNACSIRWNKPGWGDGGDGPPGDGGGDHGNDHDNDDADPSGTSLPLVTISVSVPFTFPIPLPEVFTDTVTVTRTATIGL